jgi:acyl-CoA synthetase (AMP-forming)/AMP-acid ligase II
VAPGQTGEILVRGAAVFEGYFRDPAATWEAQRAGWLRTGDLGTVDADGYLFLHGRIRALIKRGGMTIVPRDLEDPVHRIAGVRAAAALGVALSPVAATEDVVIVAEVDADAAGTRLIGLLDDVDRVVRDTLGSAPARILLVAADTLPREAGKIAYAPLRQMVLDDTFGRRLLARR